ncbi:hypothetical protein M433DRAFT_2027 [Acidomyces richmondensis BFW]|nr:MAG: hypothetical protein FE78DRAFT_66692 [Acidomyces sp. 'richmondensis']KYG48393.1 hypothetical protein M433DRAFT_2027 [Acidomyces richmondensis BFW]
MAALANAHGYFVTPKARQPGTAFADACSMQAFYNMEGSIDGNIQGLEQVAASQPDYKPKECNFWMCKGMKFADNKDNVHKFKPGQTVDLYHQIVAPHTGYANVSIVKTATNKVIAADLKKFSVYASNAVPIPNSDEHFSIKMPTDLGSKCAIAGDCVIQMFWNAPDINQTYESCIDFTLSGSTSKRDESEGLRIHARDFSVKASEE